MKKILILVLFLLVSVNLFALGSSLTEYTTGTADTLYTTVYTVYSWKYQDFGCYITNSDTLTHDLTYQVLGYMHASSNYYRTIASSTTLSDGETAIIEEAQTPYYQILIKVKNTVAADSTNYEVGYILKH